MASLNDGYMLDNEIEAARQDDDTALPERLDFTEETKGILAVENALADLGDLAADIEQAGGMSADYAMEAHRIVPGILSKDAKHFSQAPSATRLKISLEELEKGVWALIAAAVVAIIAIIYKIFKWLSGGKSDEAATPAAAAATAATQLEQDAKDTSSTQESLETAAQAIDDGQAFLKSEGIEVSDAALTGLDAAKASVQQKKLQRYNNFDSLIAKMLLDDHKYETAKLFLESGDPVFHDIITNGDYTKMAQDAGQALMQLGPVIQVKMRLIDEILKSDVHSTSATARLAHLKSLNSDAIKEPIRVKFRDKDMTMEEVARALSIMKDGTEKKKSNERINFDVLFRRMSNIYKAPTNRNIFVALKNSVTEVSLIEQQMEKMQKLADNLSHDGSAGSASDGVGVQVRQAILRLGKDVSGYAHLAHELKYYALHSHYLAKEAVGFGTEIVRKIAQALKQDGQRVPPEWEKVLHNLKTELDGLKNLYKNAAPKRK